MPAPRLDHKAALPPPRDAVQPHCLWCGAAIDNSSGALYCNRTHQVEQRNRRRVNSRYPVRPCPHSGKLALPYRGTAIVWARRQQQRYYRCRCGVYHLTKQAATGRNCGTGPWEP